MSDFPAAIGQKLADKWLATLAAPGPVGAARALHRAVVSVRDRYQAGVPTAWAAHTHFGV
jgi:hypothetical protein